MPAERVTVTMPGQVVEEIDRMERNRSAFVLEAVRNEIKRRRRKALRQSLRNPHSDTRELTDAGFPEWSSGLPTEDVSELVDLGSGTPVRWEPDRGWVRGRR